jgi:hypothetical protein
MEEPMLLCDIRQVFETAHVTMPTSIIKLARAVEDPADYDDQQSWCCGLIAKETPDGVLLCEYCVKGRGGPKAQWRIHRDGRVERLPDNPYDWPWVGRDEPPQRDWGEPDPVVELPEPQERRKKKRRA